MISSRFVVLRCPHRNTAKPQPKHVPHTLAMNLLSFDVAQEKKEDEALIAGFFLFRFFGFFFGFFYLLAEPALATSGNMATVLPRHAKEARPASCAHVMSAGAQDEGRAATMD